MKVMEAATLKKKSNISKGKVKKSLRNVLCRPDPVFWPEVSEEHVKVLQCNLEKYKIVIPEIKKLHWKEIKSIPKEKRPKPPKLPRVEGLIFGITEVNLAVQSKECSAVLIESSVNPRTIVLPLIEQCMLTKIPILCVKGLKKCTSTNFGIPTSCLGIKCKSCEDLQNKINGLVKFYKPLHSASKNDKIADRIMEVEAAIDNNKTPVECPYLYRTSKRTRVFNPSTVDTMSKKMFVGQDFIEFSDKPDQKTGNKSYINMILKKISNNQNRAKRK